MAKGGNSIQDIVQTLPRSLQRRFESLGGFVAGVIEEQREHDSRDDRLTDEDVALIKFLTLVYTLDRFFRSGTDNALGAAQVFEELGAGGFSVGTTAFTTTSEATFRGERLANGLHSVVQHTSFAETLGQARTVRDLVRNLRRDLLNGKRLG
jgi:hypothetical protein